MKIGLVKPTLLLLIVFANQLSLAQVMKTAVSGLKDQAMADIQSKYDYYRQTAQQIWNFAEVGYKEQKSTALLQQVLSDNGFSVQKAVADIPTAFVASYGSGQPVIGILAEFDALPGMSQEAVPEKKSIPGQAAGHACGHNLFGTASVAAGIEIKKLIEQKKITGEHEK